MKPILTAAALSLFLCVSSYALPRQDNEKDKRDQPAPKERQDEKKPQQDDRKQQDDKKAQDEKKQQDDKKQQDEKNRDRSHPDRNQQDRTQQQERDRTQEQGRDQRSGEAPRQDPNRVQDNREQQSARNNGNRGRGQRIADDRYRSSFGRQHTFHVQRGGNGGGGQTFYYSGYSFEYVEAWPSAWSYDDDFYIESVGDDYYLYDLRHPEMRILVIVIG
jgi:hypothetical protein